MTDQDGQAATASDNGAPPGDDNIGRPWPPRVYDFLTGGRENYTADQVFGRRIAGLVPWVQQSMWITRRHGTTAALVLARELGISQVIDLGCGYPSHRGTEGGSGAVPSGEDIPPHTYDVVRSVHGADTRVVYVDIESSVIGRARITLTEPPGTSAVRADARDVSALLVESGVLEVIDLNRPVGVLLHAVLDWFTDAEAALLLRELHDLLPAGSAISVVHATADDDPVGMATLANAYAEEGVDYRPRSREAIEKLLGVWELLPPGLQPTARWREDQPPHIPEHLRTTWKLPAASSHAYAAVTAPKTARPEPATVTSVLAGEPAPSPGFLLVGATLRALREKTGTGLEPAAARMLVPPLALDLWESGGHRLAPRVGTTLQALDMDDYEAERLLRRLLNQADHTWSEQLEYERFEFADPYPGNSDRANAVLRAATTIRAFALDRIPEPFLTPAYAALFPREQLIGSAAGPLPPITAPLAQDTQSASWTLVLDECLIERAYGHPHVLAEQLDHLLRLDALPHITVRVLRLDTPFAMPVASLTEHILIGGALWRLNGFVYRGLSRGDSCRLLLDRALENSASGPVSRQLLERARNRALAAASSPTRPATSESARDA